MKSCSTTHTWITRSTPKPHAAIRLFCFPYAGGGSVVFHHWGAELPADVEVCAVKLPGRESRLAEPPIPRLAPLVNALAEGLLPYMDRPFAFFGHSLGGLVSFELIHELLRRQCPTPVHLLVSATRAPHIPPDGPAIHDLPTPAFIEQLRDFKGTPEAILNNPAMMDILLPVLRADFAISETRAHSEKTPIACPIAVFSGLQDTIVSEDALLAWQPYTHSAFTKHSIAGGHFFINHARSELLDKVRQVLTPYLPQTRSASAGSSLGEPSP